MSITSRPLASEADKPAMAALAREFRGQHLHVTDLPWRLTSWALDDPGNARLWFDTDGRLLAWAVLQTVWWTFDCVCRPELDESLHPELLAWAEARARAVLHTNYGHPCWFVPVFSDQAGRIRQLEAAGYISQADIGEDSWTKVYMERPANLPVREYRIPSGFTIRPLAGEDEAEAYASLHQVTFETKNMTAAWRRRTLQHPEHVPELDLVAVSPEGQLAAFCIGWLDRQEAVGQIEPLGCHPAFQNYALGRLALAECLRRMQALGAQKVVVETDNYRDTAFRLYEHMGFQVLRDVRMYRKDIE